MSNTFKVGDRVRLINDKEISVRSIREGDEFIVRKLASSIGAIYLTDPATGKPPVTDNYGNSLEDGYNYSAKYFELVHPDALGNLREAVDKAREAGYVVDVTVTKTVKETL